MDREPVAVVAEVARVLERLGVIYAVGGSLASSLYGHARATNDADLIADLRLSHIPALVSALEQEFYLDATVVEAATHEGGSFNAIHYDTAFKVDVFVCGADAFRAAELHRRRAESADGATLQWISPEDTVLAKLRWFRDGGETSDRQWHDVLGVLQVRGGRLDRAYLDAGARDLGVGDLLEKALSEAGAA